ncbi:MAG TPA: hypothetical protein VF221_10930 [Chloroflexota bacterium]
MRTMRGPRYDLSELKPFLWIFGAASFLMGLATILTFGVIAHFAWILVAGGVVLVVLSFCLEPLLDLLAGTGTDVAEVEQQMPVTQDTEPVTETDETLERVRNRLA